LFRKPLVVEENCVSTERFLERKLIIVVQTVMVLMKIKY
jgi:hypothetical protein